MGIGWVTYQKGGPIIGSSWKSQWSQWCFNLKGYEVGPFDGYNLYPFIFGHLADFSSEPSEVYGSKWLVTVGVVVVPNEQVLWDPFRPWPFCWRSYLGVILTPWSSKYFTKWLGSTGYFTYLYMGEIFVFFHPLIRSPLILTNPTGHPSNHYKWPN